MKLTKGICKSNERLDGKTVLITGANSGIGLETARDFAQRGARVILAVRNMEKGIDAAKDIMRTTRTNNLVVRKLDLACLEEIRKFAQQINDGEKRLDILVLNAGIAGINRKYLTEENLELHMVSNHFGHFLLTNLLLPLLCESSIIKDRPSTDPVRIVVVSSVMHWYGKIEFDNLNSEKHFNPARIYNDTKLANLLFTFEMSRKLKKEGFNNVIVNAVHPGPVQTNLFHNLNYLGLIIKFLVGLLYYSPKEGAQTAIFCGVSQDIAHISGAYFSACKRTKSSPDSLNEKLARELWERSAQIVDLMPHETVIWN
eukprot:10754.XXX_233636_232627_1 [CDS] Oithona nana genome sequencing.